MKRMASAAIAALSLLVAGCATTAGGQAPAADPAAEPARPFIERSLVLAPGTVGEFRLTSINDYPDHPASGAGMRYVHPEFPDVALNLFVYPVGRADPEEALDHGMSQLRDELSAMVEQGHYTDLSYGPEVHFDLDGVDADGEAAAMDAPVGRRLGLRFARDGVHMDSVAFLFYRGLYLYKGRISAPATAMPGENLDRFANRAMALVVPAVRVRSTGGCANREVLVDPDAGDEELQRQLLRGLLESSRRAEAEDCAAVLDTQVPEGHQSQLLVYPASMWR